MDTFREEWDLQNLVYALDSECGLDFYTYQNLKRRIKARFGDESVRAMVCTVWWYTDDQYRIQLGVVGYSLWRDILVASTETEQKKIELGM